MNPAVTARVPTPALGWHGLPGGTPASSQPRLHAHSNQGTVTTSSRHSTALEEWAGMAAMLTSSPCQPANAGVEKQGDVREATEGHVAMQAILWGHIHRAPA